MCGKWWGKSKRDCPNFLQNYRANQGSRQVQTVYKVVRPFGLPKIYCSCYALGIFSQAYEMNKETTANVGKLFVFKSLRIIVAKEIYVYPAGVEEGPAQEPEQEAIESMAEAELVNV
jgi:hypothetical protein